MPGCGRARATRPSYRASNCRIGAAFRWTSRDVRQRVGPAIGDVACRVEGCVQRVPVRHGEVVDRRGRLAAAGAACTAATRRSTPSRCSGEENSPQSKLGRQGTGRPRPRTCRSPAPGAHRRRVRTGATTKAAPLACRPAAAASEARSRAEPRTQRLPLRYPLVLELVSGDEPPRPRRVGDRPVMAAPADGPVLGRRDAHAPRVQRRRERGFGQAIGRRQHAATVRTGGPVAIE